MILALVLLALAGYTLWVFNRLVRARNQVQVAWSDVDVQLQRRHDLVPLLVETVRGYAQYESALLERVTEERSQARQAQGLAQRSDQEVALGVDLGRLVALREAYPELKASDNFRQLSVQLVDIEDALQHARRFYNGSVRQYNTDIQRFPDLLMARVTGFHDADFFAAETDARATVAVHLGTEPTP
ncbi:MAG: LemA family protein [Dokdonella sp.]